MFMIMPSSSYDAIFAETPGRYKMYFKIPQGAKYSTKKIDDNANNIIAVAIKAGSRAYPTRYNRIEKGNNMHPYGPRGGMNGICGIVYIPVDNDTSTSDKHH